MGAHPKIRRMSSLLILNFVHSEFDNESFVNSLIHNSPTLDHCFEAIYGQPFTRGVGITFFNRKRSIISTFMPISRWIINSLAYELILKNLKNFLFRYVLFSDEGYWNRYKDENKRYSLPAMRLKQLTANRKGWLCYSFDLYTLGMLVI
jgi:hypothetical protein